MRVALDKGEGYPPKQSLLLENDEEATRGCMNDCVQLTPFTAEDCSRPRAAMMLAPLVRVSTPGRIR